MGFHDGEQEDESSPLLGRSNAGDSGVKRSKSCFCWVISITGAVSLVSAIVLCYFLYYKTVIGLRVLALNVWGMPAAVGSKDKELRISAIGEFVRKAEHDLYLFSELWMRPDHETIRKKLPEGYFMSEYGDFALPTCDGRALPAFCSGLAIVSKFPFIEKNFFEYSYHGDILKPDMEYWARKGAGQVRISPLPNLLVDVFVTHTCAVGADYSNSYYREHQVQELIGWVNKSNADFVILGGDFNTSPTDNETSYHNLKTAMVSSMEEFFLDIKEWLIPSKSTYGNPRNSYSHMYQPVLYDYIWHKAQGWNIIWTNLFEVPWLTCLKEIVHPSGYQQSHKHQEKVSFSDHEAVRSNLYLWKSLF